jgi:hypothetical protein
MTLWNKGLDIQESYKIPMKRLNPKEFQRFSNMRSTSWKISYVSLSQIPMFVLCYTQTLEKFPVL